MFGRPLTLVDPCRASLFRWIGAARGLFSGKARLPSESVGFKWGDGRTAWRVRQLGTQALGITWSGPGWLFDTYAQARWAEEYAGRMEAAKQATVEEHGAQLYNAVQSLRFGRKAERLLWLIHQRVIASRTSLLRLPDYLPAAVAWGPDRSDWSRDWRSELTAILESLAFLHVADGPKEGRPAFGRRTALLTHAADLRGTLEDACDTDCPGHGGPRHHHFLVNVGRGFLGALEEFAEEDDDTGIRTYNFAIGSARSEGPSLRRIGKAGRLVSIYLPAKLAAPAICRTLPRRASDLIQVLVRETTRNTRRGRRTMTEAATFTGNRIPDASVGKPIACDFLDPQGQYVGFNGNGRRKGLGYLITSPKGWMARAGYRVEEVKLFLAELEDLCRPLGLIPVGIRPKSNKCLDLDGLRVMARTSVGLCRLDKMHLRFYTSSDYVSRWDHFFGWDSPIPQHAEAEEDSSALALAMERKKISRRALAEGIGVDPSFVAKLVSKKKPWPTKLLRRARTWVDSRAEGPIQVAPIVPIVSRVACGAHSPLDAALAYRKLGWSIIPQIPGKKKPPVEWKAFQERPPTKKMLVSWFTKWPNAGLALVLGPVSNAFVLDIDGPEAHAALVDRIGGEPMAPKVLSGSGKPYRYHLFFRCPNLPTRAKQTPWHPGLEFRGKGGIVVLPPSLHKSGGRYAWAKDQSLDDLPLPELPLEVLDALKPVTSPSSRMEIDEVSFEQASRSTKEFLSGACSEGPRWNERLFNAACDLKGRGVPLEVVEPLLLQGAKPWNDGESQQAISTIHSAYSKQRSPGRC